MWFAGDGNGGDIRDASCIVDLVVHISYNPWTRILIQQVFSKAMLGIGLSIERTRQVLTSNKAPGLD